jgi:hypothetical protein
MATSRLRCSKSLGGAATAIGGPPSTDWLYSLSLALAIVGVLALVLLILGLLDVRAVTRHFNVH